MPTLGAVCCRLFQGWRLPLPTVRTLGSPASHLMAKTAPLEPPCHPRSGGTTPPSPGQIWSSVKCWVCYLATRINKQVAGRVSWRPYAGVKQQVVAWLVEADLPPECGGKRQVCPQIWLRVATPTWFWELIDVESRGFLLLFRNLILRLDRSCFL